MLSGLTLASVFNFCLAFALLGQTVIAQSLKDAAGANFYVGAAVSITTLGDATFKSLAASEFSSVTAENEMKWDSLEKQQGVFTFDQADVVASFAEVNGLSLRGHTLVWHSQLPAFVSALTGDTLLSVMNNHITEVMTRYKGAIFAWDVVNEVFNDDGSFRDSVFFTQLGERFIETAFTTARSVDPGTKLFINDFNIEGINAKSDALFRVVSSLTSKRLIDGVGFQSHFIVGSVPQDLRANLQRFADLGLQVAITELDIRTTLPTSEVKLTQQAADFAFVVNACRAISNCVGITLWGISDKFSWVLTTFPGFGSPLLFDDSFNKKSAFASTLQALQAGSA